jgi:hypothetical protein
LETQTNLQTDPVRAESISATADVDAVETKPPVPAAKKKAKTPAVQNGAVDGAS